VMSDKAFKRAVLQGLEHIIIHLTPDRYSNSDTRHCGACGATRSDSQHTKMKHSEDCALDLIAKALK
jgi:hypothetical protein